MGTNFYWRVVAEVLPTGEPVPVERDDPVVHIGKCSAAGLYCWDCNLTLCPGGNARIHYSRPEERWPERCHRCGQGKAGELGFAASRGQRPTGVRGASSFSWAQLPSEVERLCQERLHEALIEDEYGDTYTGEQFLAMLEANCPIRFTDTVGRRFS